jgi:amidase
VIRSFRDVDIHCMITEDACMTTWVGRTATEIAAAVRAGDVTARKVTEDHLSRITSLNDELGAFVRVRTTRAEREAEEVDARSDRTALPLAGVPVAVKDNIPVAGEPMRSGSAATPDTTQEKDHPVVTRLRAAGAVVVGLTNLPELGIFPFSDSVFAISRNPWDVHRTAGGSSGGSAAAVASALVPIAHGNDGAGSIRIPAAACGLFGIKPGPGVVPAEIGEDDWGGMAENGPLTTTVSDAALMLSVMAGRSFEIGEPARLRVAISVKGTSPIVRVDNVYAEPVRRTGALLATLGHTVREADPAYPFSSGMITVARWFTGPAAEADPALDPRRERRTRRHLAVGRVLGRLRPPRDTDRDRLRAALEPFFADTDVLVMPSLATLAPEARRWGEGSWLRSVNTAIAFAPMSGVWNLAGYPAANVPVGTVRTAGSTLPLSVQLVGVPGSEATLLSLAAQLEKAHPWQRHAPDYSPRR